MLLQMFLCGRSAKNAFSVRFAICAVIDPARIAGLIAICAVGLAPAPVFAQQSLSDQIQRLQRDLQDVQNYLYRSDTVPTGTSAPGAANAASESAAILQRQVLELQTQMRDLTGRLERVNHDIGQVGNRLDKLVGDVDLRLQALENGTGPVASTQSNFGGQTVAGAPNPPPPAVTRNADGTTIISSQTVTDSAPLAPGSNLLGTVRQRDVDAVQQGQAPVRSSASPAERRPAGVAPAPRPAPGPSQVTIGNAQQAAVQTRLLPEGTVQEQYTYAFKLLRKRDYQNAEAALREFIERNPDTSLAGNAMYWMGETFYVRKNYPEAARIFLDAYQRFPKGNKAADNLFKLAKSLAQIGENESACTTYTELVKSFPTANVRILASARKDMSELGCS